MAQLQRVHADGTASSATADEQKLAARLAKDPWGRFGGRQGKIARLRAQEEAALAAMQAAVAGPSANATGAAAAAAAAPVDRKKKRKQDADASANMAADAPRVRKKKGAKPAAADADTAAVDAPKAKRKTGAKAAAAAHAGPDALATAKAQAETARIAAAVQNFRRTPSEGWWGAKRFVSAGALGSAAEEREAAANERTAFTEDTQVLFRTFHTFCQVGTRLSQLASMLYAVVSSSLLLCATDAPMSCQSHTC